MNTKNNNHANSALAIEGEFIELYKLLKAANLASSGGEAKYFIAEGQVRVNGAIESRKRKKISVGDRVAFNGQTIDVIRSKDD